MTFPVVEATNISAETSAVTAHDVSLPAGVVAGNLLLALLGFPVGSGGLGDEAGWAEELDNTVLALLSRIADGLEGATVQLDSVNSETSTHTTYRISGASGEVEIATTSSINNPPSLTPSWGARDTLWIAGVRAKRTTGGLITVSAAPANYSGLVVSNSVNTGGNTIRLATAWRQLNAASENPGAFTVSGASEGVAFLIAVRTDPNLDGVFAVAATSSGALVGSTLADGVLGANGAAAVDFNTDGRLSAAGVAAGAFAGTVAIDATLSVAGSGAALFVGGLQDGVFASDAIAAAVFDSGLVSDGDVVVDAVAGVSWVGEEHFRWSRAGPVANSWTPEAGGGYA